MAEHRYPWFPIVMEHPTQGTLLLWAVFRRDEDDGTEVIVTEDQYQGRFHQIARVLVDAPDEFRFVNDFDQTIVIRPATEEDAINGYGIPLPTDILGALMNNSIADPTISAAVDDAGDVHTVILETGLGLYARYARTWLLLTDITPIEQLDMIAVPYDDLEHYDMADEKGHSISIRDLNPIEVPATSGIGPDRTVPVTPVTASAAVQVIVASPADLDDAIAYAATDEGAGSRWYVGRRAKAFGWPTPLPWETEQ